MAVNSKGHVYRVHALEQRRTVRPMRRPRRSSSNSTRTAISSARVGKGLYAWSFAHSVRIDKDDNIWAIDKGSDMIVKFNPEGPRAVGVRPAQGIGGRGHRGPGSTSIRRSPPIDGLFRQPTDVAWDSQGNIYISDGYINSRVAKYDHQWQLGEILGHQGHRPRPVQPAPFHRHRHATTMSMSAIARTTASRCSTPTATSSACSDRRAARSHDQGGVRSRRRRANV